MHRHGLWKDKDGASDDRHKRETMTIEAATNSNMWEIAADVEVLERKGLCTKQDLHGITTEFHRKNPAQHS